MRPDPDNATLRRYLLGLLAESDAESLEEQYLARPEILEQIRAVEDDLLDDYAAGRLSPAEVEPFEKRFFPSRQARVVAARALRLAAVAEVRSPSRSFDPALRTRPALILALAASLLLAVLAVRLWPARPPAVATASVPPSSLARPVAPSPSAVPDVSAPRLPVEIVMALSPVLLRSSAAPAELFVPGDAVTLVLELEGDPARLPKSASKLEGEIRTVEGDHVWTGEAPRGTVSSAKGRLASIRVPASRLPTGDYLVTLSAGEEPIYRYFVRVRARP
jgi:hypothetical protein